MYIKGSEIKKIRSGSFEDAIENVYSLIAEKYNDSDITVLSTFEDRAIVLIGDGQIREVKFGTSESGKLSILEDVEAEDVRLIDSSMVESHVSKELKAIVASLVKGEDVSRTQVRELIPLVNEDGVYWISDVFNMLHEASENSRWHKMYEANQEKIRTSMYGSIRDIESSVPKTRYSNIPEGKLGNFTSDLKESIEIVRKVYEKCSNDCNGSTFKDETGFLGAIRDSLIDEAQAVVSLLRKADGLMRDSDLPQMAKAHDKLADRAKSFAVVSGYLCSKAQASQ